jgi:hypothetical protein
MTNRRWFDDEHFQYGLERTLGATYRQAADVGEVLATAARIADSDCDGWVREWTATAGAVWVAARNAERTGRRVTALVGYRRAATYYATALYRMWHCSEPERRLDVWRRQRQCWDRIVDLSPVPGERIFIDYEGTSLPGFFFRAPDAAPGEPRPLVVVNNGSDGATSQMWALGGAAAADRGYHWMTFDGPGQQAALFEQGLGFRPDWEAVLTPVLDAMLARRDVVPDRVAVLGVGQAGYWIPRALAFEHRFTAAVVDPGVVDVSTSWTDALPPAMRRRLDNQGQAAFDREMLLAELFSAPAAATARFRGEPYAIASGSRYELYETVRGYRLGPEVNQIRTPMLITDSEGEPFWPGQSRQLYERLSGPKELATFSAVQGADGHCEPLGAAVREAQIFDWLERYLNPTPASTRSTAGLLAAGPLAGRP